MWQGRRDCLLTTVGLTAVLIAVSLAGGAGSAAASAGVGSQIAATGAAVDQLLVRFDGDSTSDERAEARQRSGTKLEVRLPVANLELLRLDPGISLAEATTRLEDQDSVLYAEPNFYRRLARTPNDSLFGQLWGLENTGQSVLGVTGALDADIDATNAWNVSTGVPAITVAVIDSGLDLDHRDLAPNIWTNPGESGAGKETNGRDDDLNGLTDDFRGWDWASSDNDPRDSHGHGTHVAGTIGARGDDGFGVAGVAWNARLMALRVLDNQGIGTVANVIQAYVYAQRMGAKVVNASLGGGQFSRSEFDALRALPSGLFVVAAGNEASDNDQRPAYPCAYDVGNVVCVAASDQQDGLASFSNYGATTVDLAAPGTNILSAWPGGGHAFLSGTSMATPHVSGAAALVFSKNAGASPVAVKNALLQSVDPKAGLARAVASGGRLNVARALGVEPPPPTGASAPSGAGPTVRRDTSPPTVSLRLRRRERMRRALRGGVRAHVRCSEPCRLDIRMLSLNRTRRQLRQFKIRRRALAIRKAALAGAVNKTVVLRMRASVRRRLLRVRSARLVVVLTAKDHAGNSTSIRRTITLRR